MNPIISAIRNGFTSLLKAVFPSAFPGTPQHDAANAGMCIKDYLWDMVWMRFSHACQSKAMNAASLRPDALLRLVLLQAAPSIAAYAVRWGTDRCYQRLICRALVAAKIDPKSADVDAIMSYLHEAVQAVARERMSLSLPDFLQRAVMPESPVQAWFLEACVSAEVARILPAGDPVIVFAGEQAQSALSLMEAREKFMSAYPSERPVGGPAKNGDEHSSAAHAGCGLTRGQAASMVAPRQRPWFSIMPALAGLLHGLISHKRAAIGGVALFGAVMLGGPATRTLKSAFETPLRTRDELQALADAVLSSPDQMRAHETYLNRLVEVEGGVLAMEPIYDDDGTTWYYLWLDSNLRGQAGGFFSIPVRWVCVFPASQHDCLLPVHVGDRVRVSGPFTNWVKAQGELVYRFVITTPRIRSVSPKALRAVDA